MLEKKTDTRTCTSAEPYIFAASPKILKKLNLPQILQSSVFNLVYATLLFLSEENKTTQSVPYAFDFFFIVKIQAKYHGFCLPTTYIIYTLWKSLFLSWPWK